MSRATIDIDRKTTLLNTLAQRIDIGVVTGEFLVNGRYVLEVFLGLDPLQHRSNKS